MRPATVTSPTHAVALGSVIGQGALAVQLVNGTATTRALAATIGHGATWVVPLVMIVACAGILTAALTMQRLPDPSDALRLEGICWTLLAITTTAYAWSLTSAYGWHGGPTTQTYAWSLGVACYARTWQILRDLSHYRKAAKAGIPADPAPLGEPDHNGA